MLKEGLATITFWELPKLLIELKLLVELESSIKLELLELTNISLSLMFTLSSTMRFLSCFLTITIYEHNVKLKKW